MTSRTRHDSRGPGRGGRHRARPRPGLRTPTRPGPSAAADTALRGRARALLTTAPGSAAAAAPLATVPAPRGAAPTLPADRTYRGMQVLDRRPAALPPCRRVATQEPPLPRPVAIAAARAAVLRSRTTVPRAAVTAAAWQRRLHTGASERPVPVRPGAHGPGADGPSPDGPPTPAADEGRAEQPAPAAHTVPTASTTPSAAARLRTAVLERLPLWVQLRCAVEPKTLAALAVVLLVAVGFAVHHFLDGRPEAVTAPQAAAVAAPAAPPAPSGAPSGPPYGGRGTRQLVVDVAGDVRDPGVHRLPHGSRVADALEAAGGIRPGADEEELGALNQARRLVDGEQIVVGGAARHAPGAAGPASGGAAPDAGLGAGGTPTTRISLSSATPEQLETLPGVGPVLAQHIIDYRVRHGGFTSVGQLREVDGIGDARFADIQPKVGP